MPITIRDLAEKLHPSITTVSRALDGYQDVAAETRERVIAAAHEMGYEPSYAARQLTRMLVGLIDGQPQEAQVVSVCPELVIRASTG